MLKEATGAAIAAAVGALLAARVSEEKLAKQAKATTRVVMCTGVNECKGRGECATAKNICAGQNDCKGQGLTQATEEDCKDKGGKVFTVANDMDQAK